MGKLSTVIFYNESWGQRNVLKKEHEVDHIPNEGEMVVLNIEDEYGFYRVDERVFDFADNIVHLRVKPSLRCYDLSI